ncbi:uncharacterized protein RHOBADRAFT_51248 [Rhodotorula graminis WP1]|uniref:Uncharacterized protein n=1 Tax=Rhodotorula graminis (strain WP1) TaxID=578459 RepID=A0A194S9V2_RHOGW|nr:uncharacterized protein RHOBADRAFT_51248 [Rhodotorula graminis WP1]KPV77387.1 hypothetical protein RHOBADRAFT_51248 [Rhodotorula graminis WP1]
MLSSAVRPSAQLAARASSCALCAVRRSSPRSTTSSTPPPSTAPSRSHALPTTLGKRGAASLAQAGDRVDQDDDHLGQAHDDHAPPEQHKAEEAMANLINELAHEQQEQQAAAEAASSTSTSSPTSPSTAAPPSSPLPAADPSPSSSTAAPPPPPPPPAAPPAAELTLKSLLEPSVQHGGPTLDDLRAVRPKRFTIPDATSPDSHRLVYRKAWESAVARFDRAFNKRQLADFAGEYGLALDLTDPRLRTGTKGKKQKYWKSKRIDQMTKRELIHTILVLEFHMVDPDTIPSAKSGPRTSEAFPLDDRALFLLLSPKSRTIPNLTRQLGVNVAFRRNPKTSVVELVLNGSKASVAAAKEELELLEHTCARGEFTLPGPASTLRPEVYQAISRTAKAFLAPGPLPNTLAASAIEPKLVERAERLVNAAFALHLERTSTSLFASLPANLDSLKYAMYPFSPLLAPPQHQTGGTPHFARVKTLSLAQPARGDDPAHDPDATALSELLEWSERMRLERTARQALFVPQGSGAHVGDAPSVWKLLRAPFAAEGEGEAQPERVAVRARFGHVAWPLYRSRGALDGAGEDQVELGPAFSGVWAFGRFAQWAESQLKRIKTVFIPSPPTGILDSTRVLDPLPAAPTVSPFASLLNPASASISRTDAGAHLARQTADVLSGPALESTLVRRWTYRSTGAVEKGAAPRRVEIEFELDNEGELPSVREMRVVRSEVRVVRENKVDVMVPTGAQDAQFSMSSTTVISPGEYPTSLDERTMTFHAPPPIHLSLLGHSFMLDTDHLVRRTVITPAASSSTSASASRDDGADAPATSLVTVQEAWHSLTRDGTRGTDVFALVGEGDVRGLQGDGTWKRGLEEVERRCLGRGSGVKRGGGGGGRR